HRGLACRLVAVCRRTVLVLAICERPQPRGPRRRGGGLEDAPDDKSIGANDVVVVSTFGARVNLSELKVTHFPNSSRSFGETGRLPRHPPQEFPPAFPANPPSPTPPPPHASPPAPPGFCS